MEPDIRMLDKYKTELKEMDRNISLLQSLVSRVYLVHYARVLLTFLAVLKAIVFHSIRKPFL